MADEESTCYWLDSIGFWSGIDPVVISATYRLFYYFFKYADGTSFSPQTFPRQLQLCNQHASISTFESEVACTTLWTAFRIAWKYIDDFFDIQQLIKLCPLQLVSKQNWGKLEQSFMTTIEWNIMTILDVRRCEIEGPSIIVPGKKTFRLANLLNGAI